VKLRLRPRIVLFTVLPLVGLTFVTLWVVNRAISSEVRSGIDDGLRRASATLENMLTAREEYLAVAGEVIVQDPRFFSSLTIPGTHVDPDFRATVAGVAHEFNAITRADLFEVFDAKGELIASVGPSRSDEATRRALVAGALSDRSRGSILSAPGQIFQAAVTPVFAGGRLVGVLLLGEDIGAEMAGRLRDLTRSEVTFIAGSAVPGSTIQESADRAALLDACARFAPSASEAAGTIAELQGRTHRYITLIRRLPGSEPAARTFYAVQRSHDVETAFLRDIQRRLVELGLIAALAALIAGFVVSERITSPLRRLVRAAEEIERGNYDFPIDARSGDEVGYLATRFDDMREHQRAYVARLKEVARIKSEFIDVASHELRTPVSIIRGFQELFAAGALGPLTPQQSQAVEAIGKSAETLGRIAENATQVAQIEARRLSLRVGEHGVEALLRRAVERATSGAVGRGVRVTIVAEPNVGTARVDGERIVEAVAHLVRNAIRFTADGGAVTVRAARGPARLEITVEDTGVGMSAKRQAEILDQAVLAGDSKHHHSSDGLEFNSAGMGLGIPIVRGIVNMHGGSLEVSSTEGRGSVFRIVLPIDDDLRMEAA
jgi:signal transduction histidine kinase